MEQEILQTVIRDISVIAAIVAIISATVAPVLSSLITKTFESRTKRLEIFFHEKVDAYSDFFKLLEGTSRRIPTDQYLEETKMMSKAFLFAPPKIQKKMSELIIEYMENGQSEKAKEIRCKLNNLMRKDLRK